jgi:hypothetical protein
VFSKDSLTRLSGRLLNTKAFGFDTFRSFSEMKTSWSAFQFWTESSGSDWTSWSVRHFETKLFGSDLCRRWFVLDLWTIWYVFELETRISVFELATSWSVFVLETSWSDFDASRSLRRAGAEKDSLKRSLVLLQSQLDENHDLAWPGPILNVHVHT